MNYYAVLEATNTLVLERQWKLQRCRRRCDGPARYVVLDHTGSPVYRDRGSSQRRLGLTLREVLVKLCDQSESAANARFVQLLAQLDDAEYIE